MKLIITAYLFLFSLFIIAPVAKADTVNGTNFAIKKDVAPATVSPEATVSFSITITNLSNVNTTPQTVTDTLPEGFTFVGNSVLTTVTGSQINFNPQINGNTLTWTFDGDTLQSLPPNQNIVITFQTKAGSNTGTYTNRACLTQPENVCATANVVVAVNPNTSIQNNVLFGLLVGSIALFIAISLPKTQRSFEQKVISKKF
ncbi:MAG: hypothetical protein KatS3mg084_0355 [Candidatus Dojkabacteria bacterium]|jgi:fimbrial isopeptide formation D2 family protein|nr:MAG: hypothetical protein KatS3mg084_0355 [Candidatus Dojkabacteria bacterium]